MLQSPAQFLESFISPEVRHHAKYKETIDQNLQQLDQAKFLMYSDKIESLYQRGLREDAGSVQASTINGIHNICSVFQGIGVETNNKGLANGAQLISAGTQLYSAYSAYSAITAASATASAATATTAAAATSTTSLGALLGPIGMGAGALFGIYSVLKRRKNKSGNFPDLLMQSLGVISQQVNQVNINVLKGFEKTYQYHQITLDLIDQGFKEVNASHRALHHHASNLHISLSNEIKLLLQTIQSLSDTLIDGQETISLQKFSGLIERSKNIEAGNIQNNPDAIQKTAYKFAEWSKIGGTASNPFYTGIKFVAKTRHKPSEMSELYAIMNKMINPINPYNIIDFQGLLAYIIKEPLKSGAAREVDVDALFNPDLWIQSTYRYLKLREDHPELVLDNDKSTINGIIQAADNQLAWEHEKKHSKALFESVFALYESGIKNIQTLLQEQLTQINQRLNDSYKIARADKTHIEIDLRISTQELSEKYSGLMPLNPVCAQVHSISHYVPYLVLNDGTYKKVLREWGFIASQVAHVNNGNGYQQTTRSSPATTSPMTIENKIFACAEYLGLISIAPSKTLTYRCPTESPGSGLTGNGPSSYLSDNIYSYKAVIDGTETLLQQEKHLHNERSNQHTLSEIIPVVNSLVESQVRSMIERFLKEKRMSAITGILSDATLSHDFKHDTLAAIDFSIRLMSALMTYWPDEINAMRFNALRNASELLLILNDAETYNKPWNEVLEGLFSPEYSRFKTTVLNETQQRDHVWKEDEHTLAIRELRQAAIQIREKTIVPAKPATAPSSSASEIQDLKSEMTALKQMMQVLMQQNMTLMHEVQKLTEQPQTNATSLFAYSSTTSSANQQSNQPFTNSEAHYANKQ